MQFLLNLFIKFRVDWIPFNCCFFATISCGLRQQDSKINWDRYRLEVDAGDFLADSHSDERICGISVWICGSQRLTPDNSDFQSSVLWVESKGELNFATTVGHNVPVLALLALQPFISPRKSDWTYLEIWSVETNLKLFLKLRENFH